MLPIRDSVPHKRTPWMTLLLIAANAGVFALEVGLSKAELHDAVYRFGAVPALVTRSGRAAGGEFIPPYWTLLTSMFLHAGWLHIIGNMGALWLFSNNVEDRMGPVRFVLFYLLCGVLAGVVHIVSNPASTVPVLGASGAIAGVMGAYVVLYPRSRVLTLIPVFFLPLFIEVPAIFYLGVWFYIQFFSGVAALSGGGQAAGIAWWAHVGGFVAGVVFFWPFLRRRRGR
jgi:membrane associated rhomboid family serine protease